jgi:hypothetical protein
MEGPSDSFRAEIANEVARVETENQLDEILARIDAAIQADLASPEEEPTRLIDGVTEWASVASYVVGRFYGPASPWPRDLAGWSEKAVGRLRQISDRLRNALAFALSGTGASSFSISVGFPWGISIGLSWG